MYDIGLLVVTRCLTADHLSKLFRLANSCVRSRLYLSIEKHSVSIPLISFCYNQSTALSGQIDLRLLSSNWCVHQHRRCDVILCDDSTLHSDSISSIVRKYVVSVPTEIVYSTHNPANSVSEVTDAFSEECYLEGLHSNVALGGTFDRLHVGHKILLTTGAMIANKMLTIGVTTPKLLSKKLLTELIEPISYRINKVIDFVSDIKPEIQYHAVQLTDPFGPPIHKADYQALVASRETVPGCNKINEIRLAAGFKSLPIYEIDFAEDNSTGSSSNGPCENKISSSNQRVRMLGSLLKAPLRQHVIGSPYIIGLTGGICSGKSSLAKRLEKLGAGIIDCDKLGHEAYKKGTKEFGLLVAQFGDKIVGADGEVDRKVLGSIVFGNDAEMKKLTNIVWPRIKELSEIRIRDLHSRGHEVVVLEAAVLLEAEWHILCHEVWLALITHQETLSRLISRNGWSEEKAETVIASQMTNAERFGYANVLFCTLWDPSFTQEQVNNAWKLLQKRLSNSLSACL